MHKGTLIQMMRNNILCRFMLGLCVLFYSEIAHSTNFMIGGCIAPPDIGSIMNDPGTYRKNPKEVGLWGALGDEKTVQLISVPCKPTNTTSGVLNAETKIDFSVQDDKGNPLIPDQEGRIVVRTLTEGIGLEISAQTPQPIVDVINTKPHKGWVLFKGKVTGSGANAFFDIKPGISMLRFRFVKTSEAANDAVDLRLPDKYVFFSNMEYMAGPSLVRRTVTMNVSSMIVLQTPKRTCYSINPTFERSLGTISVHNVMNNLNSSSPRVFVDFEIICQQGASVDVRITPQDPFVSGENIISQSELANKSVGVRALIQQGATYRPLLSTEFLHVDNLSTTGLLTERVPLGFEYYKISDSVTPGPIKARFNVLFNYP